MFPWFLIMQSSKIEQNLTGKEWLIAAAVVVAFLAAETLFGWWWLGL